MSNMKNLNTLKLALLLVVGGVALVLSCRRTEVDQPRKLARDFDSEVYLRWNELFLEIDRYAVGYRPGPIPHALGYLGFAAYEAVVPAIPELNSLARLYPELKMPKFDETLEYHWPAVVNEVYGFLMKRFFFHMENSYPNEFAKIERLRRALYAKYEAETTPEVLERSVQRGLEVARAFYEYERTDAAAHNAFLNPSPPYNAPKGPGFWEPTVPDFTKGLFPYWGQVRTFALREEERTVPSAYTV